MENKTKGSGLIFAVVLLFVILGMVVTLSSMTVLETKMNQKTKSSVGAFYNADSGVEWALNQIANKNSSDRISTIPSCPFSGCSVLFLGADGKVLNPAIATNTIDKVKAVRSVGTQNTGEVTQRAIEAAVASGGGGCYTSYAVPPGPADSTGKCLRDFTNKGSIGHWVYMRDMGVGIYGLTTTPPGGNVPWPVGVDGGDAFVCCM